MTAPWLPDGFHTITPNIIAENAEQAVSFLKRAFGATENYRLTLSDGRITHCELKIGDSIINVGTAMDGWPAHGLIAQIFVEAPDTLFEQAVRAGAAAITPMTDMFFGIREGRLSTIRECLVIATLKERWPQKRCSEDSGRKATDSRRKFEEMRPSHK